MLMAEPNAIVRCGTPKRIAACAKMKVDRTEMRGGLHLLITTPQATIDNERLHGYGSVVKREHPFYHVIRFLVKLYLAYTRNLVITPHDGARDRLEHAVSMVERRRPNKVNARGMYLGDRSRVSLSKVNKNKRRRRAVAKQVVKVHAKFWKAVPFAQKSYYKHLADQRKLANQKLKEDDLAHANSAWQLHIEREEKLAESYRHSLRSSEFRLNQEDMRNLELLWSSKRLGREAVLAKEKEIATPVAPLDERMYKEMNRIRREYLGPERIEPHTFEWVRAVCRRNVYLEGAVLHIREPSKPELFLLLRSIMVGTHEFCVLPLIRIEAHAGSAGAIRPFARTLFC